MAQTNVKQLVGLMDTFCEEAFRQAAGLCVSYTHYDIEVEHLFFKLVEPREGDIYEIFALHGVEIGRVEKTLTTHFEQMKSGSGNMPSLSPKLPKILEEAWMIASVEFGDSQIRSSHILLALLDDDNSYRFMQKIYDETKKVPVESVRMNFANMIKNSAEFTIGTTSGGSGAPAGGEGGKAGSKKNLDLYTIDLTAQAKEGKIDPIVGRDSEIRDSIDILIRRRKNNPLFIGEAGVGKTAVVEGMALRIAKGDVPDSLKEVSLLSLDLGALQAGAGVRGEFEKRLKAVIKEIQSSPKPIILFIDEIHTLMGAGGEKGAGDAANLIKPALARGELRTIGATTLAEHKQFIAKDPALDRRFQTIYVDEPDTDRAILMMRSVVPHFEKHHNVRILEDAVRASVTLSQRYISGRQLPDKSVDLIDTACARVALAMASTPAELDDAQREAAHIDLELERLDRELNSGTGNHGEKIEELQERRTILTTKISDLETKWSSEKTLVDEVRDLREKLIGAPEDERAAAQEAVKAKIAELEEVQAGEPLVHIDVDAQAIAAVVASWTGIPVGKMVSDELTALLNIGDSLKERVKGQDHALDIIADNLRTSRYNLANPDQPIGIFLLVGPSGVGKTETAMALSDQLFGGEKNIIAINMSEYKEAHSSSRLIGPPPGYVGFGKGGVLTEKVRNRPYSVVLLDEIEKAHYDVREFFQQVFDKGYLADSEGQIANFRNTVMIMTANVGDNTILNECFVQDEETGAIGFKEDMPSQEELKNALMPELLKTFSSSLLARMTIVPYYPLRDEIFDEIIRLKLNQVGKRLKEHHKIELSYDDEVVEIINYRCNEVQSGARNVNRIINGAVLPKISTLLIERLAGGDATTKIEIKGNDQDDFDFILS